MSDWADEKAREIVFRGPVIGNSDAENATDLRERVASALLAAVKAEREACEAIARGKAGEGERWTAVNQIAFDIADAIAARE